MQQIINKSFTCWVAEKTSETSGRKYYRVQALGVSDFAAPAPIAWPSMMGAPATAPAQAAVIPQQQTMPTQPSAFTGPAPATPTAPLVSVADIPHTAKQLQVKPQTANIPKANPFFKPQA